MESRREPGVGPSVSSEAEHGGPRSVLGAQARLAIELGWLAILALLWGSSYTLIKVAVESIPPLTLVAGRVSIAAIVLTLIAWRRGLSLPRSGAVWGALLLQAALLNAAPFTLMSWSEQYLDSGLTAILNATPPIFV